MSCGFFISLNYIKAGDEILFLTLGFTGRILEGVGAGMLHTAAYGEALAQNRENQNSIVAWLETAACIGNMAGLLFASFLCYFVGFVGPFAFFGLICLLLTAFMNYLIEFDKS